MKFVTPLAISLMKYGQPGFTSPGTFRLRSFYSLDGLHLHQFAHLVSCRHHLWGSKSKARRHLVRAAPASRRGSPPEGINHSSRVSGLNRSRTKHRTRSKSAFLNLGSSLRAMVRHSPHSLRRARREEGATSSRLEQLWLKEESVIITGTAPDTYVRRCSHTEVIERAPAE
jgi:hypothetical protein